MSGQAVLYSSNQLEMNIFKGKLKQGGWLPPAFFADSHFRKKGFQKDDNIFFRKKHSFLIIFLNFVNVQHFLTFCQKNLIIRAEKTFSRNNTI